MFPDQDVNRHNYQLRFMEMENKIKRCELERAELEQRFAQLMRERQECEKAAARQLKMKYKRMMELERQRAERNESLLRMLHTIDQQAASLAAKTDRLKMLKTQYESYLIRSWSSQRALPSPSPIPPTSAQQPQYFMTQPHAPSFQLPSRLTDSPKSEFVRYISDMTHAQTASYNPIPPPTALSNYINHQHQFPTQQQYMSPYLTSSSTFTQDPFMRPSGDYPTLQNSIATQPLVSKLPSTPSRSPSTILPAKKLELSNEEFIQYIDNEILKGSSATDSMVATSDPPPDIVVEPPSITSTPLPEAYLEDVTNDEDDYLRPPAVSHTLDDSPIIEEIVESTAKLDLDDIAEMRKPLTVSDDAIINQRWEKIVEVNSTARPSTKPHPGQDAPLDINESSSERTPLEDVISQTLRGVISEVEELYEAPVVSDTSIAEGLDLSTVGEEQNSSDQANDLANISAAFGEIQTEYPQSTYETEAEYPPIQDYQDYQEVAPPEYSSQDPEDYKYDYSTTDPQSVAQAQKSEDPTRWTASRHSVRSKNYSTSQSRTPETIDEVVSNGEENPPEEHISPPRSKHSSPIGENASATDIHYSEPETQPEQPVPKEVDQQQYDYSQYPQEYDPNDPNQQAAYYQQYTDEQTGQEQTQAYQDYAEHDPNQYQQATEYPGPTQYVFEQGYYDEGQPQQTMESDQNQGYYEGDPNATEQQQYYAEEQVDQAYYDQSQAEVEYANYEDQNAGAADAPVANDAPQEEMLESVAEEEEDEVKQTNDEHPQEDASPEQEVVDIRSSSDELLGGAENNLGSPVKATVSGKEDTTISSVNDESDFDFSTQ
ncbi:uncharacterized protein LOC5580295 [Aedes aegypti]|uniref:Uncharacterized protein n=1 Tax=Aedes aegypti TaxID=7159 RepID=A0A6I8T7F8_AEDAE|nr:uncharacterized protein LOC5580295 [Aedes aegypti]